MAAAANFEIEDVEGRKFWNEEYSRREKVDNELFVDSLVSKVGKSLRKDVIAAIVTYVIDAMDNDGTVSKEEWHYFLKRFGHFPDALAKCAASFFDDHGLICKWFHGNVSREESAKLLSGKHGLYLVRYASIKEFLTLSYSSNDGSVKNVLIKSVPKGWAIDDTNVFPSIPSLLSNQHSILKEEIVSKIYEKMAAQRRVNQPAASGNAYAAFDASVNPYEAAPTGGNYISVNDVIGQ